MLEVAKPLGGVAAAMDHITDHLCSKVRVFLTEVAEGVSNYRSMHNLTEQVEHQYHGRFLIELIQNGHDALGQGQGQGRIEIWLDPEDSEHGSLLVANDGEPFSWSNFEKLSALGQSDKDPQKSIGNKGIGFRSVLEITDSPQVFSRREATGSSFDGYCFGFTPTVVASLVGPVTQLGVGDSVPVWDVSGRPLIKDWSEPMLARYRARIATLGREWLAQELRFLSPYLLPVPVGNEKGRAVRFLEDAGYATVVRLPLKSPQARRKVEKQINELAPSTCLFLKNLQELTLRSGAESVRVFSRRVSELRGGGQHIALKEHGGDEWDYWHWRKLVRIPNAPEKVQAAVKSLPGRWPELEEAEVSIAVRIGGAFDQGRYSIYLPTALFTGSAVHVNAPFYGDMSRTFISFDDAYNGYLAEVAAGLAFEAATSWSDMPTAQAGLAAMDLVCPLTAEAAGQAWLQRLEAAASRGGRELAAAPIVLTERGWAAADSTYQIPNLSGCSLFHEPLLRRHATVPLLHPELASARATQFELLNTSLFGTGSARLPPATLAAMVASVAQELHTADGNWNLFWQDVVRLLPGGQRELAKHQVLLGEDGALHKVQGGTRVFFLPRQGTPDAADVDADGSTNDVPASLRASVAFLNDRIELYDARRGNAQNAVREYLGVSGFVTPFRVETIFSEILKPLTPSLPVRYGDVTAALCQDLFSWGVRLMRNVVARGRGSTETLKLLRDLPAPCRGGWYSLSDATFAAGWPVRQSQLLEDYLGALASATGKDAFAKLLMPPDHEAFQTLGGDAVRALLASGGVSEVLSLYRIAPEAWSSSFAAHPASFTLPAESPPGVGSLLWEQYVAAPRTVQLRYHGYFGYRFGQLLTFAGLEEYDALPEQTREALSTLLLAALPHWTGANWKWATVNKVSGNSDSTRFASPLLFFLRNKPWLAVRDEALSWHRPCDRWFVPADTLGPRARHYAHLHALPAKLAAQIAAERGLDTELRALGMHFFNGQDQTSDTALLQALTGAIGSDEVADVNVLLGQIRDAWNLFRPEDSSRPPDVLPVRRREGDLQQLQPTDEAPAYLPDLGTLANELEPLDLPLIAIYPAAAHRLRDWFKAQYGDSVLWVSQMSVRPAVRGNEWTGADSMPLAESNLAWLVKPLLVLVSDHRPVHSPAFRDRQEILAAAKVDWVNGLELSVIRADGLAMSRPVPAIWDGRARTLVVDELCKSDLPEMSSALAQMLGRENLELSVRFVLSNVGGLQNASDDAFKLLAPLRAFSTDEIHHVLEHLRGDIGHLVKFVRVLARAADAASDISDIESASAEEQLAAGLLRRGVNAHESAQVLDAARDASDYFEFGLALSERLTSFYSLGRWNAALESLGMPRVGNPLSKEQFCDWLEELSWIAKRVARHAIAQGTSGGATYPDLCSQYLALGKELDLAQSAWKVGFREAVAAVAPLFTRWTASSSLQEDVAGAANVDALRECLLARQIEMDIDPDEIGRANRVLAEDCVSRLDKVRLAWLLKDNAGSVPQWQSGVDAILRGLAHVLGTSAFVQDWTELETFDQARRAVLAEFGEEGAFASGLNQAQSLAQLCEQLGVSDADLEQAESNLARAREAAVRRARLIQVYGKDFEASEGNLKQLWSLISEAMPDEALAHIPELNLEQTEALDKPKSRPPKPTREKSTRAQMPPRRQPKSVDEAVGLAGEIFVYRMLRQKYGDEAVPASAWISENSRYVYEFNQPNDGFGCDFAFSVRGRQFRVEVKATQGEDDSFSLGSSEIALAMEIAGKTKRRKETFLIVHVKNALSSSPKAVVLPNPYDPTSEGLFRIEEAEARVRYRSRGNSE